MCRSIRKLVIPCSTCITLCFLTALSPFIALGDELENPFRRAKTGDWAKYKHTSRTGNSEFSYEETRTLVSNDGKTAKLKRTTHLSNGETKEYDESVDLVAPFSTAALLGYKDRKQLLIEKSDEGTERCRVGERSLDTRWTTYVLDRGGMYPAEKQIWVAKEAPFDGIVRHKLSSSFSRSLHNTVMLAYGSADDSQNELPASPSTAKNAEPKSHRNLLGQTFVLVPAGDFDMGELPLHEFLSKSLDTRTLVARLELLSRQPPKRPIFIRRDYWIGAHEVTIGDFRKFVLATDYKTDAEKDGRGGTGLLKPAQFGHDSKFTWKEYGFPVTDQHPVANVSWNDAVAFCTWLSRQEGKRYRLPSEAEWEFACRGGTTTTYHCGREAADLAGHANVADQTTLKVTPGLPWALAHDDGYAYLAPVGQFKANALGLYDMHGNVLEWCADRFSFYDPLPEFDPPKDSSVRHVVRGGNWFNDPKLAGSASRSGAEPDVRNSLMGFRLVMEAAE